MPFDPVSPDRLLSPAAAARLLGVTPGRVVQLAEAGQLPATRTALGRLFALADVERLKSEREARAAKPSNSDVPPC